MRLLGLLVVLVVSISVSAAPNDGGAAESVSYTHLTLPTKRIV